MRIRLGKLSEGEVLRCAQDFALRRSSGQACGLGRPQGGSSSNPLAPATFTPRKDRGISQKPAARKSWQWHRQNPPQNRRDFMAFPQNLTRISGNRSRGPRSCQGSG